MTSFVNENGELKSNQEYLPGILKYIKAIKNILATPNISRDEALRQVNERFGGILDTVADTKGTTVRMICNIPK